MRLARRSKTFLRLRSATTFSAIRRRAPPLPSKCTSVLARFALASSSSLTPQPARRAPDQFFLNPIKAGFFSDGCATLRWCRLLQPHLTFGTCLRRVSANRTASFRFCIASHAGFAQSNFAKIVLLLSSFCSSNAACAGVRCASLARFAGLKTINPDRSTSCTLPIGRRRPRATTTCAFSFQSANLDRSVFCLLFIVYCFSTSDNFMHYHYIIVCDFFCCMY